jgi:hypothetical protein
MPARRAKPWRAVLWLFVVAPGCKATAPSEPEPGPPQPKAEVRWVQPSGGDVAPLVRAEQARASSAGRRLIVYVGAVWCEPCQRFHDAAQHGDLDATFPTLTLLEFDIDRDRQRLAAAGYASRYIPLFAVPKEDGTASGRQIEGGIKGDGAVGFIAGKLKDLLDGK